MKVVFMGTPQFAVPTLEALCEKHRVLAVVCQPDKPNNRGNKIVFGAIKQLAIKKDLNVLQPETVKDEDFIKRMTALEPDVIVVAAYGQILPAEILYMPRFGCVNVHGSLLPKYRGAAPIQWAIINGETRTGITIMRMNEGLDAGDMIAKHHISTEICDTYGSLSEKLAVVGADELIKSLSKIESGTAKIIMQNDAEATYAPLIKKETGKIDWNSGGKDIVNLIRGLNPSPVAFSELNGQKIKIWRAELFDSSDDKSDFGAIIGVIKNRGIIVNAKDESVIITELQANGSKVMSAPDFIRGREIKNGMVLN